MKKKLFILTLISCLLLLIFSINIGVTYYIKNKLTNEVKRSSELTLDFKELSFNVLTNCLHFEGLDVSKMGEFELLARSVSIGNINWWSLYFDKKISIASVEIDSLGLNQLSTTNKKKRLTTKKNFSNINIEHLVVKNGKFVNTSSNTLEIKAFDLDLKSLIYNTSVSEKLPFSYKNINATFKKMRYCYNLYDCINIDTIYVNNSTIDIKSASLKTRYKRSQLSKILDYQKDHFDLNFPEVILQNYRVENHRKKLSISARRVDLDTPRLIFYRDKNLSEPKKYKPLYGEIFDRLRASLLISFPNINVCDAFVAYEVLLKNKKDIGAINFNAINAKLAIDNKQESGYLKFDSTARFMNKSPIDLSFSFNNLKGNTFVAEGNVKNFKTEYINTFLYQVLNTKLKGFAEETYFTITANNKKAKGKIKMKYQDLELQFMKRDALKINKVASTIANLFLNSGSKTDINGYRNGEIDVNREINKSFFSYLWLSLKDGILNTLTGKPTI